MATTRKISADLYNTVSTNENITNIHFARDGRHYFNVFTVNEKQKDGSAKPVQYARTKEVKTQVPGKTLGTITLAGVPETAITETISRADLLKMTPEAPVAAPAN